MPYKLLFILLEGDDDERFFEKIVKPHLQKRYSTTKFWKYSQQKQERIVNIVKSINSMKADYICVRDFNDAPCITAKKEKITGKFNQLIPKNMPRIEFMVEILENYDVEIAKGRNRSFGYFMNKWINDGNGV